jgi:hypothetical protein
MLHEKKTKMEEILNKDDDSFYRITKLDIVLISLVLLFSIFSILWVSADQIRQPMQHQVAVIYQENVKLKEVNIDKDLIFSILDGKMDIKVENGKVRVLDSDCPQKICVKMGWIQNNGQTIVCVPNHILIRIESNESQSIDAISY